MNTKRRFLTRHFVNALALGLAFSLPGSQAAWGQVQALSPSSQVAVQGYAFPLAYQMGGQPVVLNGAGTRKIAFFNVYVMGLYLPHKTRSAEDAMQMPGNKGFVLYILRELPMRLFNRLMIQGIEKGASDSELQLLRPDLDRLETMFANQPPAEAGDMLSIDWENGKGAVITFKGKTMGQAFTNPLFFHRILKVWLGDDPVSEKLRDALLVG